jgi:hypothetical protein
MRSAAAEVIEVLVSLDLAYLDVGQNHLNGLAAAKRAIGE